MKRTYQLLTILFALTLSFSSCLDDGEYIIAGKADSSLEGKTVILATFYGKDSIRSLKKTTIDGGSFQFSGKAYLKQFSMISIEGLSNLPRQKLMLDEGEIRVTAGKYRFSVSGTPLNDRVNEFEKIHEKHLTTYSRITGADSISAREKLQEKHTQYEHDFIKENIKNPLGVFYYNQRLKDLSAWYIPDLYSLLSKEVQKDKDLKKIVDFRKRHEELVKQAADSTLKYTDFELHTTATDIKGVHLTQNLSRYIDKSDYTYLYFWASWCQYCLDDMDEIRQVYNKYRGHGLNLIAISPDMDPALWKNSIKRLDMPYLHLATLSDSLYTEIKKAYNVLDTPHGVLINGDGKIISPLLSSSELDEKMAALTANSRTRPARVYTEVQTTYEPVREAYVEDPEESEASDEPKNEKAKNSVTSEPNQQTEEPEDSKESADIEPAPAKENDVTANIEEDIASVEEE